MEETLYPERIRHRAAHELFIADFVQMRDELRARGVTPEVSDWLDRRIADWLRYHIRVNDIPLGEYLARRRGQPDEAVARRRDGRWQS
jgi:hemerythrin